MIKTLATQTNKGGGSVDTEQYRKLALAILAAIPMDLDDQTADGWTRDPQGLAIAMRQTLSPGKREKEWKLTVFERLDTRIADLKLITRTRRALIGEGPGYRRDSEHIIYVGQLVQMSQDKLLRLRNFGRESLKDVIEVLGDLELHLNMDVHGWVPPNQRDP